MFRDKLLEIQQALNLMNTTPPEHWQAVADQAIVTVDSMLKEHPPRPDLSGCNFCLEGPKNRIQVQISTDGLQQSANCTREVFDGGWLRYVLVCGDFTIRVIASPQNQISIDSNLRSKDEADTPYNLAVDGIETMIKNMLLCGMEIIDPAIVQSIFRAIEECEADS